MVTIDALKISGKQVVLGCLAWHLHLYVSPARIAVSGDTLQWFKSSNKQGSNPATIGS